MIPKQEKMYQMNKNCEKMVIKYPNRHNIFQMAFKYIKSQSKAIPNLPKLGFLA
jgi:hypothetical protein